jgi:hypothetical protein
LVFSEKLGPPRPRVLCYPVNYTPSKLQPQKQTNDAVTVIRKQLFRDVHIFVSSRVFGHMAVDGIAYRLDGRTGLEIRYRCTVWILPAFSQATSS